MGFLEIYWTFSTPFATLTANVLSHICKSGSEGTGNGSDEEGSKDSAAASESDSDAVGSAAEEGIDDEEAKELNEDTKEEEKAKEQSFSEETSSKEAGGTSKNHKKGEKSSDTETNGTGTAEESSAEPKKWNLRRNRPMLDFTTMEELHEMDDYDSEDDNDWRPTQGKKKGKASTGNEKEGSEEEEDGGSDEEDNEGDDNETSSSDSEEDGKKLKRKAAKSTGAFDEETNDSHSTSHGKGNEVKSSLLLHYCLNVKHQQEMFLKGYNTFIQQRCIKLVTSDSKDFRMLQNVFWIKNK